MSAVFDLAVIGSGYAGSLMSMVARRLGLSVLLLERGSHPRMAIGESSTPLSNLLLEGLADRYDLPRLRPLSKWGTWQQMYPKLGCGLKRGFSFFHHAIDGATSDPRGWRDRQMLVAASPHDAIADTHWFRADVDAWLVDEARALGVEYIDELALESATRESAGWVLMGPKRGRVITVRARFLIDASGPGGFLSRALGLGRAPLPGVPATAALYTHFRNVDRFAAASERTRNTAGYAPDDAALHHVFRGGWMWMLRFANGITSAGVAVTQATAERLRLSEGEAAWARLLKALHEMQHQFGRARPCVPFVYVPRLSFRSAQMAGSGWAMLPSAAGFVDPLLSTGFPLTLLGIARLGSALEKSWRSPELLTADSAEYAAITDAELLATARLVGALYRSFGDFALFRVLSLLYFAAASYAETARRLGRPELARSFLLQSHPRFGPEMERLLSRAREGMEEGERNVLIEDVYRFVEEFDVAGLGKRPADACYPVRAEDLLDAREKLGASRVEIDAMLARSGFAVAAPAPDAVPAGPFTR